ncbi:MAG TPA: thiamine pyrophosphate-dependent dehydrogenase E1 component subunit alpha [Chloroflexota bacterium]|nr:thiamine pyrophosphate-dependent dehydrogenase E1 component subunit alpha [Chloroflexota bacterium]
MAASSQTQVPDRREWLRSMLLIRAFEDKVQQLFMQGLVEGTTHLCQGQEAVPVGAIGALAPDDYLTITYRGHGHALARGVDPERAFAELMGRETGLCKGRGGSMHFTDFSRGLIGAFAIVGAGLPVALGAAMSSKLRGTSQAAMTFFGDGATNIGSFHEALNMASVWKAPVVFVCENNLYGEYSPLRTTTPVDDLAVRATSYAMPGVVVDGNDAQAVYREAAAAVARARAGEGPTLLECKTYRYSGHSRTDPGKYRKPGELDAWKGRDPIVLLGERLAVDGELSAAAQEDLRREVQDQIEGAAARAASAPWPAVEEMGRYVYAE